MQSTGHSQGRSTTELTEQTLNEVLAWTLLEDHVLLKYTPAVIIYDLTQDVLDLGAFNIVDLRSDEALWCSTVDDLFFQEKRPSRQIEVATLVIGHIRNGAT